jgi:hypothetical protein
MRRAVFVALTVVALMVPTLAFAETPGDQPTESAAELDSVPHVDRDGNRISDRLDAILRRRHPVIGSRSWYLHRCRFCGFE